MYDFKQQLKAAYDADAKRRDASGSKRDQWKGDVREEFVNLLKAENKKTILELGAGVGIDSEYFLDNNFDVLATDLSEEMVKMCRRRGVTAKVTDLYDINQLDRKFDAVYSLNVLLHVPRRDLNKVLKSIYNVLNPDGIFFYGVYGGLDEEKEIIDKSKMGLPRHFSYLSDNSLLEIAKEQFKIVTFNPINIGSRTPGFHFQSLLLRKAPLQQ